MHWDTYRPILNPVQSYLLHLLTTQPFSRVQTLFCRVTLLLSPSPPPCAPAPANTQNKAIPSISWRALVDQRQSSSPNPRSNSDVVSSGYTGRPPRGRPKQAKEQKTRNKRTLPRLRTKGRKYTATSLRRYRNTFFLARKRPFHATQQVRTPTMNTIKSQLNGQTHRQE